MGGKPSAPEAGGGFRIFKVNPGSPAAEAGLEVFFDFIVAINGIKLDSEQKSFFSQIQAAENKNTKAVVYNIRTHTSRDVVITPRRWGGAGLLGAVVRYDSLDNADSQGIRVLEVFPNSPAQQAGIVPFKDYLLGTTEVMFRDLDELVEIVNLCIGRKMQIYVYNSDSESIREVVIMPDHNWGGDGAIGADIRTGLLHRIPPPRRGYMFHAHQATLAGHQMAPQAQTMAPLTPSPPTSTSQPSRAVSADSTAPASSPMDAASTGAGAVAPPPAIIVPGEAPQAECLAAPIAAPNSEQAPTLVPALEVSLPQEAVGLPSFSPTLEGVVVPTKTPASTPMNAAEHSDLDHSIPLASPSVVRYLPDMAPGPGQVPADLNPPMVAAATGADAAVVAAVPPTGPTSDLN